MSPRPTPEAVEEALAYLVDHAYEGDYSDVVKVEDAEETLRAALAAKDAEIASVRGAYRTTFNSLEAMEASRSEARAERDALRAEAADPPCHTCPMCTEIFEAEPDEWGLVECTWDGCSHTFESATS